MFLRGSLVSLPGAHPQPPSVPWGGLGTTGFPSERHPRDWPQGHQLLDSLADSGQPMQPEEEMRVEKQGSDLVLLPPFPD